MKGLEAFFFFLQFTELIVISLCAMHIMQQAVLFSASTHELYITKLQRLYVYFIIVNRLIRKKKPDDLYTPLSNYPIRLFDPARPSHSNHTPNHLTFHKSHLYAVGTVLKLWTVHHKWYIVCRNLFSHPTSFARGMAADDNLLR